ncbi:restriction endonuclease PLD domain-containing protein [Clostridium sp. CTA-1]
MCTNLAKSILFNPLNLDVNRLCILSGYATPNMASWFIRNVHINTTRSIDVSLIVGMVPYDGLSVSIHDGFKELMHEAMPTGISSFKCSYVSENPPVHTKLYIWLKNDNPVIAFTGSANFTQIAFSKARKEYMVECDPIEAYNYYFNVENSTIFCNHSEVEDYVILHPTHPVLDLENRPQRSLDGTGVQSVCLSLLSRTGEIGTKSGLNWGQRNKRNRNEAYIGLPASIVRTGFFPLDKQHFTVITDDGHQLILRVEQENNKAITTPLSNAQLGEYFRNRLNIPNGEYIWRKDLEQYGRTDVTFYKLDDEQYYMDFSKNGTELIVD